MQHHSFALGLSFSDGALKSKLERIRRFFANQIVDQAFLSKQIIKSTFGEIPKMDLIMDRTNWKFGKTDINYLVLIAKIGTATIPLFWDLLDNQGCSSATQRSRLLEKFKETFGLGCIRSFTADREFVGAEWLSYLYSNSIPFYIRLKDNRIVEWNKREKGRLKDFFKNLKEDEEIPLYTMVNGLQLLVVGKKLKDGYLVVCSNTKNEKGALTTYQKRWSIERCFKDMKSQGFNIEKTHMTNPDRLMKLMSIIAVAITVASICGISQNCAFKKTVKSPLYSYFTMGLRFIKTNLESFTVVEIFLQNAQKILSEG